MANVAGTPLTALFAITDLVSSVLPDAISSFIDKFSVSGLSSLTSPGAILHAGALQPLLPIFGENAPEFDIGIGTLSIPLLHSGVPFQLGMTRAAVTGNLEPAASAWRLDMLLADFILTLDGLEPAIFVKETGTAARHLLRDTSRSGVRIIGSATLRLQKTAPGAPVQVLFVDTPDPFDPTAPTGAVAELVFSPPHFFLGSSEVGMTVGKLLFDASETFSPPQVLERNQGPAWVGLAIGEATVYAPRNLPVVGDLSGGVKNVLLGSPMGIQGEFELQFGRNALDPATFQFLQEPGAVPRSASGTGLSRTVDIEGGHDTPVLIRASFTLPAPPGGGTLVEWKAIWRFPDVAASEGDSASGLVQHGKALKVEPIEVVTIDGEEEEFHHPEITFRFVAAGHAPTVKAAVSGTDIENVIHLGGTVDALKTITLTAETDAPGTSEFTWEIIGHGGPHTGATFTPDLTGLVNGWTIKLKQKVSGEDGFRTAHVAVSLVESGRFVIGALGGVFDATAPAVPLELSEAEATFSLSDFHATGVFNPVGEQAVIDPVLPANVRVPPDSFARVVIPEGGAPAIDIFDRHVQILMTFEKTDLVGWGELKPAQVHSAGNAENLQSQLLAWAGNYPDAEFIVIGRCDDVGSGGNANPVVETPDNFNIELAKKRAERGRGLLTALTGSASGTVIAGTKVFTRGETSNWDSGSSAGDAKEERAELEMTGAEKSEARNEASLANGWLIKSVFAGQHTQWGNSENADPDSERIRKQFRRIDIYAITDQTPLAGARRAESSVGAVLPTYRRSYVPAEDRELAAVPSSAPAIDYRVKLVIGWDSPTAVSFADAVPTLMEAEFAWSPAELPLPPVTPGGSAPPIDKEVLTVYAKWIHDSRTGFTKATLGIRSEGDPNGLFASPQPNLVAAAALGPMLLSGVDLDNDVIGSGARVAALLAAAAFAGVNIGGGGPLVGAGSKVAVMALEAEAQTAALGDVGADYQIKLTTDYVCTIHVNGGVLGIKTHADHPVKIRYKKVGIEFDNTKSDWEKVGLAYATDSMEVMDPGRWQIEGALGDLLRVVEVSMGRGSLWIELRVAAALELGPVEVTEAIFRLTWPDGDPPPAIPDFELRGFTATLDVAEVITGEGRLRIEDGGVIRAGIDAAIAPLGLSVNAGLAMGRPPSIAPSIFLELFLGVQFSTPLPLAQSGAAIYGFKGQFVANGKRRLGPSQDPVGRELEWWRAQPGSKYEPEKDQYALGVGVVIGTLPDVSFSFSAGGMVVVAFPDVEVILGIDVELLSVPDTAVTDEGQTEGNITGLVVINDSGVKVAVSAQYSIPNLVEVKIPFSANFPSTLRGSYVRLGSDGQTAHGRHGEPVTITLLPGILDARVWSYLMVEQDGLPFLGGDSRFSFEGFSVGFGAGWGIEWKAGPIKLSASAKVLVGFGTDPLLIKGGVFVQGELDLVVVSISARGELILTYFEGEAYLEGKFCGEVDLFFFSLEGCVGVKIGTKSTPPAPPPPPPVASVSLTDRRDRVMGEAKQGGGALAAAPLFDLTSGSNEGVPPKDNNTVWPDTAPVLHFRHSIMDGEQANQFAIPPLSGAHAWFGGNRFKYAYRLDRLTLRRRSGNVLVSGTGPLQAVWMSTPYRQPDASGSGNPVPSDHEGPNLKLLDWNPWNWAVNLDDGGDATNGDPADEAGSLCDAFPQPRRACVFGVNATAYGLLGARIAPDIPAPPPYPSAFTAVGEPVVRTPQADVKGRDLQTLAVSFGLTLDGGGVVDTPFAVPHEGRTLTRGLLLPWLRRAASGGFVETPIPWEARFDRQVTRPSVTLLICDAPGRPGDTEKICTQFERLKIGGEHTEIRADGFLIRTLDPAKTFTLNDRVDASQEPAHFGSDGRADIHFSEIGIAVIPDSPSAQLELHIIKGTDKPVTVRAFDAAGAMAQEFEIDGPQGEPLAALLSAPGGVARAELTGGGGEAFLYMICRFGGGAQPEPNRKCADFSGLKPDQELDEVSADFLLISAIGRRKLRLTDSVDLSGAAPAPGGDGSVEIAFAKEGLQAKLKGACPALEITFLLAGDEPVKVTGFSADGKPVAATETFGGSGIATIRLAAEDGSPLAGFTAIGGNGKSALVRVCCLGGAQESECETFRRLKIGAELERARGAWLTVSPAKQGEFLKVIDIVDQSGAAPVKGEDASGELFIPHGGVFIDLDEAAAEAEVWVMLFAEPVTATAFDADGQEIAVAVSGSAQSAPYRLVLRSVKLITRILVTGGSGEAVLFRVCKGGSQARREQCIDFSGASLRTRSVESFVHEGLTFADPAGGKTLSLADKANSAAEPAKPGSDGVPELQFRSGSLRIELPQPASHVSIRLMLFAGPVKGAARSSLGARIATDATTDEQNVEQVLTFTGAGIASIELFGGDGEARILQVCVSAKSGGGGGIGVSPGDPFGIPRAKLNPAALRGGEPLVTGMIGGKLADRWIGRTLMTGGKEGNGCRVIEFQPEREAAGPWDGFAIGTALGVRITLLSICGIDQVQVSRRGADQAARAARLAALLDIAALPANERRELLLEPGQAYDISVEWSYLSWTANEDATDSPPEPPAGSFIPGTPQVFSFAVAQQQINSELGQDGLNEFIFDPRDTARYVSLIEPSDGRSAQFTDDPIWVHFDAGHVEQLVELYGRKIDVAVSRTDPPPQSTPAQLQGVLEPLPPLSKSWAHAPMALQPVAYQRINEAVFEAPCMPDIPVAGGASLAARYPLEKLAMYDLEVLAPLTNGNDPRTVMATRFVTSRYSGPRGLVEALGFSIGSTAPFRPAEIILDGGAAIPGGAAETSDALLGALLTAIGADTLPLPVNEPETYLVWQLTGADWRIEGILVDSLESLNRIGAVLVNPGSASERAEIGTRMKLSRATIGGTALTVHRATENWTRVFLKPAAPIAPGAGDHELRLEFETSDGPLTGARTIGGRPAMLEREGL